MKPTNQQTNKQKQQQKKQVFAWMAFDVRLLKRTQSNWPVKQSMILLPKNQAQLSNYDASI